MANAARLVTADELERMPEDDFRYELVRGRLIRMSPVAPPHGRVTAVLTARLWNHVTDRSLGEVWNEVGFRLASDPDTVRAPDVAFVTDDRLPQPDARGFYRGAPDVAFEVLSPDDRKADVREKVEEYLAIGTQVVVVIDPRKQRATVHQPGLPSTILTSNDTLDLHPVIRDWRLKLSDLFTPPRRAAL